MKHLVYIILLISLLPSAVLATPPVSSGHVSPNELNLVIDDVISRPEYTWRFPREKAAEADGSKSIMTYFFEKIGMHLKQSAKWVIKKIENLADWISSWFPKKRIKAKEKKEPVNWRSSIRVMIYVLLVVTACILGVLLYRMWRQRQRSTRRAATAVSKKLPDIMSEDTVADELPSDEWMKMASDLLQKGELRAALRAIFLACIAHLAQREHITIEKYKSNREYIQELHRRAHDMPATLEAFEGNVHIIERVWYGMHQATDSMISQFTQNKDVITDDK